MLREMNIAAPPRWAVRDHVGTGLMECRLARAIARCIGGEGNNGITTYVPRKWGTYDDGSASIDRPRATTYLVLARRA
jgi:hypothetical protein